VDRSIAPTDALNGALARQGSFDDRAPSVRLSQQFDLALHVGRGARLGFPIFELDRFHAAEKHHLQRQDRLMVTCSWARDVLLENGVWRTPIDIVPLGVDRTVFNERVHPSEKRTADTVFMGVGKLERRKGQRELLAAFEAAFTPKDSVKLVLICHNPFVDETTFRAMLAPFLKSPMARRITLVLKPLPTQRELAAVMATADCGVFPVRAEGWNLEALEMLSLGKQVIATACTAHTAFLHDGNARLIEASALEESVPGESRGRWAAWGTSQHDQLVDQLRVVHRQRQAGELAMNQHGIETAEQFSWRASADAFLRSVASAR
jgi:glycosyltransferase involved in cell wall biosynthesis